MNVLQNKILCLLLSIFIAINSISYSYAENKVFEVDNLSIQKESRFATEVVIGGALVATIATVAVASGISISNDNELYDFANGFYRHYQDNWDIIEQVFKASVYIGANKVVSVGSDFLAYIKDYLELSFGVTPCIGYMGDIPLFTNNSPSFRHTIDFSLLSLNSTYYLSPDVSFVLTDNSNGYKVGFTYPAYGGSKTIYKTFSDSVVGFYGYHSSKGANTVSLKYGVNINIFTAYLEYFSSALVYNPTGSFDWSKNIDTNLENDGSVSVYVPGNLGDLTGVGSNDVIYNPSKNPPYDLPIGGVIDIPIVDNPSISIDNSVSIPGDTVLDPDLPGTDFPSFPSFGDSLDFSPMYLTGVTEKFPFSLPWDLGRLLDKFDVEPKAPIFEVPIISETIELDLTIFNEWAGIIRFFVLIGFILSLIFISTKLMS